MKKYFLPFFILLFMPIPLSFTQEREKTFFIPAIGDTLDLVERDFYNLFPNVKDFQWAVFYLKQNDIVTAKVCCVVAGKVEFRIYENYLVGLGNLLRYLEEVDKVSASTPSGHEIIAYKTDRTEIKGELINISENSILMFPNQDGISLIDDNNLITIINKSDLLKIEIPNDRYFDNCLISTYTGGAIVGLLTGGIAVIVTKNKSESNVAPGLIASIGCLVGTVITYIIISGDYEYKIDRDYDLSDIKEYARFKSFEPMYLKKIK
jgi:hypothetical protein